MKARPSVLLQKKSVGPSSTHRLWLVTRIGASRVWNLPLALLLLISMCLTPRAEAIELDGTWSTTYRENIRVRVCFGSFLQWIPELYDQATGWEKLIAAVQNVLDLWNVYGQVRVRFVYDGAANDSSPECLPHGEPPSGYVYVRAEESHPGDCAGAVDCYLACGMPSTSISKCAVSFYGKTSTKADINWSFDHTDGGQLPSKR